MVKQISIFTENSKGAIQTITSLLAKESIGITGFVTNDSAEYGTIRMLVTDPEKTKQILEENGYLCRISMVTAVEITDQPGSLDALLAVIRETNVNVDYIYVTYGRESHLPIAVFHTGSELEMEMILNDRGYKVLSSGSLKWNDLH